jgi:hypothetical protein
LIFLIDFFLDNVFFVTMPPEMQVICASPDGHLYSN